VILKYLASKLIEVVIDVFVERNKTSEMLERIDELERKIERLERDRNVRNPRLWS
jgi:tetrahydromethanopterin S-methyltransferase subunit G